MRRARDATEALLKINDVRHVGDCGLSALLRHRRIKSGRPSSSELKTNKTYGRSLTKYVTLHSYNNNAHDSVNIRHNNQLLCMLAHHMFFFQLKKNQS